MEGEPINLTIAKRMFGFNFIGPNELIPLFSKMGFGDVVRNLEVPSIQFSLKILKKYSKTHILVLGVGAVNGKALTINFFREIFGCNPLKGEPCFYNQDWYIKEDFAANKCLQSKWYLLRKEVIESCRALNPDLYSCDHLPPAVLCVYVFFAFVCYRHELLWERDFVWCNDVDHNGDRIYVGRYFDVSGINKNGFNIHRYLKIRRSYSAVDYL